jgi:uncharacterized protein (TIGR03083 family)
MLRPARPVEVLELLDEERAELLALLRSLDEKDRAASTACSDWSVHDVALHLLHDDLRLLSRWRDRYEGGAEVGGEQWEELVSSLDGANELWVEVARGISPRLLGELLELSGRLTAEHFAGLAPGAPGDVVAWAGPDRAPSWLCIAREFTERWIHQQHIRTAVGRPGLHGPRFVAPVLATFMRSLPSAYAALEAPAGTEVAVIVEGSAGGPWTVKRTEDGWGLHEGRSSEAAAVIEIDQDTAWRHFSRNVTPKTARSRSKVSGTKKLAAPFFDAVAAIVPRRRGGRG